MLELKGHIGSRLVVSVSVTAEPNEAVDHTVEKMVQ